MKKFNTIEEEAKWLADYNRKTNRDIESIFWFPASDEIRLLETTRELSDEDTGQLYPFYFPAFTDKDVCIGHTIAIALTHPDRLKELSLPVNWGSLDTAKKL